MTFMITFDSLTKKRLVNIPYNQYSTYHLLSHTMFFPFLPCSPLYRSCSVEGEQEEPPPEEPARYRRPAVGPWRDGP